MQVRIVPWYLSSPHEQLTRSMGGACTICAPDPQHSVCWRVLPSCPAQDPQPASWFYAAQNNTTDKAPPTIGLSSSAGSRTTCHAHSSPSQPCPILLVSAQLQLCGQAPDVIMQSALSAVQFFVAQQEMSGGMVQQQLQRRIVKLQEACRKKLEEVHQGYTQVRFKARVYTHPHTHMCAHAQGPSHRCPHLHPETHSITLAQVLTSMLRGATSSTQGRADT